MVRSAVRQEIFLLSKTIRETLGYTQRPMEWILVAIVQGVGLKQRRRDAEHTLPSKAEAKNEKSCSTAFQNILKTCTYNIAFLFAAIFLKRKAEV